MPDWLQRLVRRMSFGGGKRLVVVRGADPSHLGLICHALAAHAPRLCYGLEPLLTLSAGATVVFALPAAELPAANLARPLFSQRALSAVWLMSDDDYVMAQQRAPDLLDWASHTIVATPWVPQFAVDGLRRLDEHFPGLVWQGSRAALDPILEASGAPPAATAPGPADYAALVAALAADQDRWIAVPVVDEVDGLRLRAARVEAGRRGRIVALGAAVPGWPVFAPRVATWDEVGRAGPARALAADCEAAALQDGGEASPLEALSGQAPLPALRAVLQRADLDHLRAHQDRAAKHALRALDPAALDPAALDPAALDLIAAWADRAPTPCALTSAPPRLAAACLPALLSAGSWDEAARIARSMAWRDLSARWGRPAPEGRARRSRTRPPAAAGERLADLTSLAETLGKGHPGYAASLHALGLARATQGRLREAEDLLRAALTIQEKALSADHPDHAASLNALAKVLIRQGRLREAEALLREALATWEHPQDQDHPDRAASLRALADVLRRQGRYAEERAALAAAHPDALGSKPARARKARAGR